MAAETPPAILPLIADPHRWQLLSELARSDRRVGELTELLGKPQNLVSYHLGELRAAGLVIARRSAADRRDVYYRVDLDRYRRMLAEAGAALHPGLALVARPPGPPHRSGRTPRVLFLCTGNSSRSQMAEALITARSASTIESRSAGSDPKPLHPEAVRVMAERGIDIAGRETKHLRRFARARFDRVITLCDKVREVCPEFPGAKATAHWSILDPAAEAGAGSTSPFDDVAAELEQRVEFLIAELAEPTPEGRRHAR